MNAGIFIGIISLTLVACSRTATTNADDGEATQHQVVMGFNSDSAFRNIAAQVDFGPRTPGSEGHEECKEYIISTLQRYGADEVVLQEFDGKFYTGQTFPLTNIIARFQPEASKRVLLGAHWDTRPWGDMDNTSEGRSNPIPGANDGGSGVAVLLEIARLLGQRPADVGVDLVFFDGEDSGHSNGWENDESTWCIGSQYWRKHLPYTKDNLPEYGIIFDMVGGKDARFHREVSSDIHAKDLADKVWTTARKTGFASKFVNSAGGQIIDDHLQVNKAGIPCIVIIESLNAKTQSFNPTWHTQDDNMGSIDRSSLKAAGQTVVNLLYEKQL